VIGGVIGGPQEKINKGRRIEGMKNKTTGVIPEG
jgi:hypothetical protein